MTTTSIEAVYVDSDFDPLFHSDPFRPHLIVEPEEPRFSGLYDKDGNMLYHAKPAAGFLSFDTAGV